MEVESRQLIDAQFDRAVEIIQSLPKTGPIQTGYEEKLDMYSLYKQATVGNVQGSRPPVWDMLGRAKWDAWAKHKNLDPYQAKWLYVDALLKVLRKYSDKTVARDLVRELESYAGDPANLVMSGISAHSPKSSSSGSSIVGPIASTSQRMSGQLQLPTHGTPVQRAPLASAEALGSTDEETSDDDDEANDTVPATIATPHGPASQLNRPQSSLSSRPYRTPMASTMLIGSPPPNNVPTTQPHPGFHTQSAFAESATSIPSSVYPTTTVSYPEPGRPLSTEPTSSAHGYPSRAGFRPQTQTPFRQYALQTNNQPTSVPMLERAVESVQVHLAAITERLETLEGLLHHSSLSIASGQRSPGYAAGSPFGGDVIRWDIDDMGMWSLVLRPMARAFRLFKKLMAFLANGENRSPTFIVVRRLFLDITFVLSILALFKAGWHKSGVRRKEVYAALRGLWRAIAGQPAPRQLIERGV